MGLFRSIGKFVKNTTALKFLPGTGRSGAKRAENAANQQTEALKAERAQIEAQTKKQRKQAQRLAVTGMRSRRTASFFMNSANEGSSTIG